MTMMIAEQTGATMAMMLIGAYLLGSVPFGLLIGLMRGVDIRQLGSGNIGATNLGRVVGKRWGYLGFVLDVAKGLIPTLLAGMQLRSQTVGQAYDMNVTALLLWLGVGAAAIVGHMFPVYLKFKGGKGVATSLGVVLGIYPFFTLTAAFALLIWLSVWAMTRYVSLASITAAVGFPLGFGLLVLRIESWQMKTLWPLFVFACLMGLLIIVRHRSNIQRLLSGTENRPTAKAPTDSPDRDDEPKQP